MRNWLKYSVLPRLRTHRNKLLMAIVWRLPKSLIYWSVIRATVSNTPDDQNPCETKAIEILKGMS